MPIYEYRCDQCDHVFEELQGFSDPPPERCPSCGAAESVGRLVSRSSFHLQGGGWYADDYSGGSDSTTTADSANDSTEAPADKGATGGDTSSTTEAAAE